MWKAITDSFLTQWKYKKFVLFFWFITFIFAIISVGPYMERLTQYFSHSMITELLNQKIFSVISGEFQADNPSAYPMFMATAFWLGIFLIFLNIGLSGGFLYAFLRDNSSIATALKGGFRHYKSLLMIYIINLALIVVIFLLYLLVSKILGKLLGSSSEVPLFFTAVISVGLMIPFWLWKDLFYDFLRIVHLNNPSLRLSRKVPVALSLCTKKLWFLLLFSGIMHGILLMLFVAGHLLNKPFDQVSTIMILVSFVLTQLMIFIRIFWRQWFWQGEIAIFRNSVYYVSHPDFVKLND